jgi:prepilin-type N-terminal cleavage/methylation domain-containing protein
MNRRGLTLVELLAVTAIIGLLVALLLPAVQTARESARRTHCANNLRQIGLALHGHHASNGRLPFVSNWMTTDPKRSWVEAMLPYLDQKVLYDKINFTQSIWNGANATLWSGQRLPAFECPSNPHAAAMRPVFGDFYSPPRNILLPVGCYFPSAGPARFAPASVPLDCPSANSFCAVVGSHGDSATLAATPGMFSYRAPLEMSFASVRDGQSSTLMLGEVRGELNYYMSQISLVGGAFNTGNRINSVFIGNPADASLGYNNGLPNRIGAASHHPGGAGFCMGDGAVRFLTDDIEFSVYNGLGCRNDARFGVPLTAGVP